MDTFVKVQDGKAPGSATVAFCWPDAPRRSRRWESKPRKYYQRTDARFIGGFALPHGARSVTAL